MKIHKPGKSFTGVVRYLSHDTGKAESANRVNWTHTINLANEDHLPSAVNEMIWTFRAADQLKREAGVSTRGSKLERPVKHFSLNWHPSETPSREEMIEATKQYLKHMGMDNRQAILFSHTDKSHAHVHIVVNVVSPEDGRALQMPFEYRRTQSWAREYEREHGKVFCEERLKGKAERQNSPPRHVHEAFKPAEVAFERDESKRRVKTPDFFERGETATLNGKEWEALKSFQRQQREQYFADGKKAFKDLRKQVYQEVRNEFRGEWNAYYAARRSGGNPAELASIKVAILQGQQKALDERRDAASDKLRESRDTDYKAILEQQKIDRAALRVQQSRGVRTHRIFDTIYPSQSVPHVSEDAMQSRWRSGEAIPERLATRDAFDRSAGIVVDPVFQRASNERAVDHRDIRRTERREEQESAPREMTETRVEQQRTETAREMNDRAREKEAHQASLVHRASWNRHRRYRSRGD